MSYVTASAPSHTLSQFADDTLAFLRGYASLRAFWDKIDAFERASGMRANRPKTIGLRAGPLRRKPPPLIPELRTHLIKWVGEGTWTKLLGIPFWEETETDDFWESLYQSVKRLIAGWTGHITNSPFGRANLANAMVYSRIRYVLSVMVPPRWFTLSIDEDVQALVWAKDYLFDKNEIGSMLDYSRWMKAGSQTLKTKDGFGLGLIGSSSL